MSLRRLLLGYALALGVACAALWGAMRLDPLRAPGELRIVSLWREGARVARHVVTSEAAALAPACGAGCTRIVERVVDEGPLPSWPRALLAISVVAGRDGIHASLGGRSAYLTPDDLLARQATRNGARLADQELRIGLTDPDAALQQLAAELGVTQAELLARGRLQRFVVRREHTSEPGWPLAAADLRPEALRASLRAAAAYLVRSQDADGRFAYELDAVSGERLPGYNWPRHGGATLMLAEVGRALGDREATQAALRASRLLRDSLTVACGELRCIGEGTVVDAGSAALALLAYSELTLTGVTREFEGEVAALSAFLRSLQRPDGELMHLYDRDARKPRDVQLPYYSGEAALALGRAARITAPRENLQAASKLLSRQVRRGLFYNRYSYGAEHWTCQALDELWDRAPDRDALAFCLDHQAYNRSNQFRADNPLGDYAGGIASNPYAPPRFAPTASRNEGAVATLSAALAAGMSRAQLAPLVQQVESSLAFMLRYQLRPGPQYLMRDPDKAYGAWPGSPIDLSVRIDYPQHVAGSMLRHLQLLAAGKLR